MRKSTKAVLLSGLVFPGIGHLVFRQYLRAWLLIIGSLAAISVVVRIAFRQAESIMDRVASGEVPLDTGAISNLVANASSASDERISGIALVVYLACWLVGIIDAYRIGSAQERS